MQITIVRGQSNKVALTLQEKQTLVEPYFLFRLINQAQQTEKAFIAADTSSYPDRANRFTIIESTTESLLAGQVTLSPDGRWEYEVYEQSSSSNLDYRSATTLLQSGICNVIAASVSPTYNEHSSTTTYKEYNG